MWYNSVSIGRSGIEQNMKGGFYMLTPRQEAFCLAYAKCGNATEAYKAAGYKAKSDKVAGANAARMIGNDRVKARLGQLREETASVAIAEAVEVQEWLTKVMRGQEDEKGDETSIRDRLRAAELLAKMQGLFLARQDVNIQGAVPVVLVDDITTEYS